jgi:hypothetical protein
LGQQRGSGGEVRGGIFKEERRGKTYTTPFLTLGNETIDNGIKSVAIRVIGDRFIGVDRFPNVI